MQLRVPLSLASFEKSGKVAAQSPLMRFVFRGLDHCWIDQQGRWSHIYHLDGRQNPNESVPESEVFYTLNVLLGLSRVEGATSEFRGALKEIYQRNVPLLLELPVPRYAIGMALWAAAELDLPLPATVEQRVREVLADRSDWERFRAQDLGMILTGVCAQARTAPERWDELAKELFEFLASRFVAPSGLFYDAATGLRRRFGSFATNTYLSIACYVVGAQYKDERAIRLAHACTRRLLDLQGPQGEWPWFFDAVSGRVVDFYEVYSVHQDGMAPALLELAEQNGFGSEADQAMRKGFAWIFGDNQLGRSMLVPEHGLIYRSHVRKGELQSKSTRVVRAVANAVIGRSSKLAQPADLVLRKECRSYHLGWVVWSFARRKDLPEITHHPALMD